MSGIEFEENRGVVAIYENSGPEIFVEASTLKELLATAQARLRWCTVRTTKKTFLVKIRAGV